MNVFYEHVEEEEEGKNIPIVAPISWGKIAIKNQKKKKKPTQLRDQTQNLNNSIKKEKERDKKFK